MISKRHLLLFLLLIEIKKKTFLWFELWFNFSSLHQIFLICQFCCCIYNQISSAVADADIVIVISHLWSSPSFQSTAISQTILPHLPWDCFVPCCFLGIGQHRQSVSPFHCGSPQCLCLLLSLSQIHNPGGPQARHRRPKTPRHRHQRCVLEVRGHQVQEEWSLPGRHWVSQPPGRNSLF